MKTIHIALSDDVAGDADYERIKIACEDGRCGPDSVHHASCVGLRGHIQIGAATRSEPHPRTFNNVMRHNYRPLTQTEKQQMDEIKDMGLEFLALLHNVNGSLTQFNTQGDDAKLGSRELSLAQTKIEEAVMWAVKHVTG